MARTSPAGHQHWDPYAVWQILLHSHPVHIEDPSGSCGHIDRDTLVEFCEAIADYPDFLQDVLLLIAHADGLAAAVSALDSAIREHLAAVAANPPAGIAGAHVRLPD